jgi:hypothetical protein
MKYRIKIIIKDNKRINGGKYKYHNRKPIIENDIQLLKRKASIL